MREISFSEGNIDGEIEEGQPRGREVDVYFFRHGQATGESPDAELTKLGIQQAEEAAENFFQEVQAAGGVIKFLSSRTKRAMQTMETMQEYIRRVILERNITNVRLFSPKERTAITAAGVIGPLKEQGIEDPVEYWLTNPDVLKGKSPDEISGKIQKMLSIIKKVADRLPPGEKVHYAAVTHEVPQAALIHSATNKTLNELGGNIKNCESFQVHIEGKSKKNPMINFRGNQAELAL